jgi:hypothetical protein
MPLKDIVPLTSWALVAREQMLQQINRQHAYVLLHALVEQQVGRDGCPIVISSPPPLATRRLAVGVHDAAWGSTAVLRHVYSSSGTGGWLLWVLCHVALHLMRLVIPRAVD